MAGDGSFLFDEEAQARRRLRIAAACGAAVALLATLLGLGEMVDLRLYDAWQTARPHQPSAQVVIVGVDDKSIAFYGGLPWPRKIHAQLVRKLKAAGARVIAFDYLFDPRPSEDVAPPAPPPPPGTRSKPAPAVAPLPSSNDDFAAAIREAGNVVFGYTFDKLGDRSSPGATPPDYVAQSAIPEYDDSGLRILPAPVVVPAEAKLAAAAAAMGHVNALADPDGNIRQLPLLIRHGDHTYPSLSLQVVRLYQQTKPEEVRVAGNLVKLGYADVPISEKGTVLLNWPRAEADGNIFPVFSVKEVLGNEVKAEDLRDKVVFVAGVAKGVDDHNFPFRQDAPAVLMHATLVDNVFNLDFVRWPTWSKILEKILFAAFLVAGILFYPRLKTSHLLLAGPLLLLALFATTLFLFLVKGVLLRAFFPALAIVLPLVASVGLKLKETEKVSRDVEGERLESQKLLGLSFQEKGMLDMALATYNKLPMTPEMKIVYLNLGVDYDHRGQKEKAFLAWKRLYDVDPSYEDVAARMEGLRRAGVGTALFLDPTRGPAAGATGAGAGATAMPATVMPATAIDGARTNVSSDTNETRGLAATTPSPGTHATAQEENAATRAYAQPPPGAQQFGRYEILQKLGRGAMGDVYKVRDPKIGRIAALKTIRVDLDFTAQQMIELRQRFYREAQTAGRLAHPNIVTIYDVGEEQGISYIVMEFVEGDTLTNMVKKRKTLTLPQIKRVLVDVATGLNYAHENGVYHRDVKPDNIMVAKAGHIKVMDFGIARVVESDMTRTGSILGTPAYMSPEQFAGKKVDGRSDIFSLGVMLYELLTSKRPFTGGTATEIMFAIMQKDPLPPSEVNTSLAKAWDAVLTKALAKDPAARYQTALEFAAAVEETG